LGLWVIAAVLGGLGLYQRLVHGEQAADFSSYVPWGLWVAAYIYFSGLSAGAFLLAAAAYALKIKVLEPIARLCLLIALVTLLMGLLAIGLDLGHLERAVLVFIRPQFHSMMTWMVWLYSAYLVLLLAMLMRGSPNASSNLRGLGLLGIFLALGFAGGVGALFGTVAAREYWHTSLYPIFFMVGALTSGIALVTAYVAWLWPARDAAWRELLILLGRIVLSLVLIEFVMEIAEYLVPAWYGIGSGYDLVVYTLFGPYWYVFWVFHLLLGVAAPVALLALRRDPGGIGLATALIAVMFMAVRLNLVIPGLITPEIQGLAEAYSDPVGGKLSFLYLPTWFEWQIVIGIVAAGVALWFVGMRLFPRILPDSSQSSEVRS
jgi:molybdopterin-containing oxidoreductase family membrane subunit